MTEKFPCLLVLLFATTVRAAPYAGYCYPSGIQAGATNRFVVGGQRLGQIHDGWISGEGVRIVKVEHVRNFPVPNGLNQGKWLNAWMRAICDGKRERPPFGVADRDLAGWSRHPWWETMGTLPPLEFSMVAHNLLTPRNALQMSPALSERLIVTIAAAPDAAPGVRDLILFDGRATTAPRPFVVSAEPRVAEPLFMPPHKGAPRKERLLRLPVALDGQIRPGETDVFTLALDKGPVTFLLTGREFQPYLGDAVPGFFNPVMRLTDAHGRELAFADDFAYLPDPILSARIPAPGTYRLEIRDNLFRGRDDFVYSVTCRAGDQTIPTVCARAFACYPPSAAHNATDTTSSLRLTGTVATPGRSNRHPFTVREPGEWEFELVARRQGSPLDGVLALYGPCTPGNAKDPPLLAIWDDATNAVLIGSIPQTTCDPIGHHRFDRAGDYLLTVRDRIGAGGRDYRYDLRLAPAGPTFDVYTTSSSVLFHRGARDRASLKVKVVRRNGFTGAVTLEDTPELHFDRATVPTNASETTVLCSPTRRDWEGTRRVHVTARAKTNAGALLRRPVIPADEAEQAFAYTHLLPARGLSLTMHGMRRDAATLPTWIPMPHDPFLPPRVLRPNEASLATTPTDFNDGILQTHFATPVTFARDQSRAETYAFEPTGGDTSALLARTVLGGISRFVFSDYRHADGDPRRVRYLAFAALHRPDNDILFYVPNALTNALSGTVRETARRLYDAGFCFDFASDALLARNFFVRRHRVILVPPLAEELPDDAATRLEECQKLFKVALYRAGRGAAPKKKRLNELARREQMPDGVRFMRFAGDGPDTWYFVHNTSPRTAAGPWRFNVRNKANLAVAMDPDSGKITKLAPVGRGAFAFTLENGASAWIFVTPRAP